MAEWRAEPARAAPATTGHLADAAPSVLKFGESEAPEENEAGAAGGGKLKQDAQKGRFSECLRDGAGQRQPDDSGGGASPAGDGAPGMEVPTAGAAPPAAGRRAARQARKLDKAKLRMEKSGVKLEAARDKLERQKPPKRPGPVKAARQAAMAAVRQSVHGKIYEAEEENVGVKAAHRTELAGESTLRAGARFAKKQYRTHPARRVRKWERREMKARASFQSRSLARQHPELKQNPVARAFQKKRIQRQYQKQARQAMKQAAQRAGGAAVSITQKATSAVVGFAARHPAAALAAGLGLMLVILLQSCMGSALTIGNGIMGAAGGSSYLAADADLDRAELAYTQWETELVLKAENAERSHPGYDAYRYSIAQVGHDPHALAAFLTALYNDFTFEQVEPVLRGIFEQQYSLSFTRIVERRTKTEIYIVPYTGAVYEYEVEYDYTILEVRLAARPFSEVIGPMLTTQEEQDRYAVYAAIKGNRQYVGSPFPFDWLPYVTDGYGYRVHPITRQEDNHRGVDIALAAGTPILAGGDGVVRVAGYHPSYGYNALVDYGDGVTARYAHCSALLVSAGQAVEAGQAVGLVGSTGDSTGAHLHFEIKKDGQFLNPLYFAVIPFDGQEDV